jgi:hypothetical protein
MIVSEINYVGYGQAFRHQLVFGFFENYRAFYITLSLIGTLCLIGISCNTEININRNFFVSDGLHQAERTLQTDSLANKSGI